LLNKPLAEQDYQEREAYNSLQRDLDVDFVAIARKIEPANRLRAIEIVGEIKELDDRINKTNGYRTQINYPFWKTLTLAEQEERTVEARRLIFEAEKANANAELELAIKSYEKAFKIWADIFDVYPILTSDETAQDLFESIRRYMIAIDSEELPEDFPLRTFAEIMAHEGNVDQNIYARARLDQQERAEQRRKELAEEERRREEEAKAEEMKAAEERKRLEEKKRAEEEAAAKKAAEDKKMAEEPKAAEEKKKAEDSAEKPAEDAKGDKPADDKPADDKPADESPSSDKN
jgi:hypothetical protein